MKSSVSSVAAELSVAEQVDISAASKAASIKPTIPAGRYRRTSSGHTWSGCARCGSSGMAIAPGRVMMNSGSSFRPAASSAPRLAAGRSRAPNTRWMMYWFIVQ